MLLSLSIFVTDPMWGFIITLSGAVLFEFFENSPCGIYIFDKIDSWLCGSAEYTGDNFWNSVMDILCTLVGYVVMLLVYLVR